MTTTQQDTRSVWVRDRKTGAIVGYMTPDRKLIRLANAGDLYARYLRMRREAAALDEVEAARHNTRVEFVSSDREPR